MTINYLSALPAWSPIIWSEDREIMNRDAPYKWGGQIDPPAIGEKIIVAVNNIGPAIVLSYFEQEGFLGVHCKPDNPPAWYVKQNGAEKPCHVFGAEIKKVNANG